MPRSPGSKLRIQAAPSHGTRVAQTSPSLAVHSKEERMRRFSATPLALSLALAATLGCGGGSHTTGPVTGTVDQTTADDLALQAVVNVDLVGGDAQGAIGGTPASAARATPVP